VGRIARILSFLQTVRNDAKLSDVKVDRGGSDNRTAVHFTAIGDDSQPLTTDYVLLVSVAPTGSEAVAGYLDPLSTPKSTPGDKRIYARDANGVAVVELWLKNDGTAVLSNSNGMITLQPDGIIDMNGVTIDSAGAMTIPTSLTLNGKEIAGHTHSQANDSGGDTEPDTGGNN